MTLFFLKYLRMSKKKVVTLHPNRCHGLFFRSKGTPIYIVIIKNNYNEKTISLK